MRDEEYTRGAYFLEPYVAAIPRQITPILKEKLKCTKTIVD